MPSPAVVADAALFAIFGTAPATLHAFPTARVLICGKPAITIFNSIPAVNIPPFGARNTPPPGPCLSSGIPFLPTSPRVLVGGAPIVTLTSKIIDPQAGVISVIYPGQMQVLVG